MKTIILQGIFLLLAYSTFSQGFSGKVLYSKDFKTINESEIKSSNVEAQRVFESMRGSMESLVYVLKFNEVESVFKLEESMGSDFRNVPSRAITAGRGKGLYYVNLKESYYLYENEISGQNYLVKEDEINEWKLINETKKIDDYLCYKAILTKRVYIPDVQDAIIEYVAWYCPEIPVSFGPAGFYGLPGLILELEIGRVVYKATDIIVKSQEKVINKPEKGIRMSMKDYEDMLLENINRFRRGG
jgi:GLPGLI family protein